MKIAAGIIGILVGLFSLSYVGLFGGLLGGAAGWLGSFGPAGNGMSDWADTVKLLSWLGPCLVLIGGGVTFGNALAGGTLMTLGTAALWYLLGFGSIGNDFIIPAGGASLLAFVAWFIEFENADEEAGPRDRDIRALPPMPVPQPAITAASIAAAPSTPTATDEDTDFWDILPNKSDTDALEEYLIRFPKGRFTNLARARLERRGIAISEILPGLSGQSPVAVRACANCGAEWEPDARFCSNCGVASAALKPA